MYRKYAERVTWMYKYKYKYKYGVPNQGGCRSQNDPVAVHQGGQTYTVIVSNGGGFAARFRVEYTDKDGNRVLSGYTGSIPFPGRDTIGVPEGASDVSVRIEIWKPKFGWPPYEWVHVATLRTNGREPACFKVYGTTESPHAEETSCY
jgi:hypothetical protein